MAKIQRLCGVELVEKLCQAFGPSGYEKEVRELIASQIDGLCDELYTDKGGNLIAVIRSKKQNASHKKIMISAHMDEVGFMITSVDDGGRYHFSTVGGIDPRVLSGRNVIVGDKRIPGVINSKPIHLQSPDERTKATPIDRMYIEIGAKDKAEAEQYAVMGDYAIFDSEFVYFGDSRIKAKALDDRLGCAIMCDVIYKINENKYYNETENDIYFAFTTKEEVAYSGAKVAAQNIEPDLSIVLETTAVADIEGTPEHLRVAKLGEGGVISFIDNKTIYPREVTEWAMNIAKENGIKCQYKKFISGANDAGNISLTNSGVKTLALSAPTKYLHSASCVIDVNDFFAMEDLIYKLI